MKENENSISSQSQKETEAKDSKVRKKYEKPVLTKYAPGTEPLGCLPLLWSRCRSTRKDQPANATNIGEVVGKTEG